MDQRKKEEALHYHEFPQPGKIAIVPTKKHATQHDLSLAYSPVWLSLVWLSQKTKATLINIPLKVTL